MDRKPNLTYVKKITHLMDSRFTLPGTKFRFGLDPVIGLIPGIGDLVTFSISGLIVFYLSKYGASRKVILMMMGNAALDAIIGTIPIIGQIFDFTYKANERNLRILQEHYEEGKHQGKGTKYLVFLVIIFIVALVLIVLLIWWIINFIIGFF